MKKLLFISIALCFSHSTFAAKKDSTGGCTATGVPYVTCVCFSDGACINLSDIGTHPKKI